MAVPWICSFWIWGIERDFDGIEGQPSSDTCRRTCVRMCYKGAVVVADLPHRSLQKSVWFSCPADSKEILSDMTSPKGTLWQFQYFQGWWSMLSWPKQNRYKNASQVCDSNGFNFFPIGHWEHSPYPLVTLGPRHHMMWHGKCPLLLHIMIPQALDEHILCWTWDSHMNSFMTPWWNPPNHLWILFLAVNFKRTHLFCGALSSSEQTISDLLLIPYQLNLYPLQVRIFLANLGSLCHATAKSRSMCHNARMILMARSVCTPPATRSYAKGSHPMSPVSKLSYESYSSNLVEHVRMLQNCGPFELPLKWWIWVRNKSEFEWGTPTAGWVLAHNFLLHHIPRQKSVTCTWVRGRTQSWRTLSGLKDELDNTSVTKRGSWVDSLRQSMGSGSVDGWQWSSKSSWWNWRKLKLAVLTTCYVHHETGSRCFNPHGIPLLWPRLLPFMCTWLKIAPPKWTYC